MAQSLNRVTLIGNLGRDPEVRHIDQDRVVARFSVATTESYTDRNTGQLIENTDWHNVTCWRGLAKIAETYLKKGHKVYIEGKLKTRQYQDKDGVTKYATDVVADNLIMLTPRDQNQGQQNNQQNYPPAQGSTTSFSAPQTDMGGDDDDLPF